MRRYFGRARDASGKWKFVAHTSGKTDCESAYRMAVQQGVPLKTWLKQNVVVEDWLSTMRVILPDLEPRAEPPAQFKLVYVHRQNQRWHARIWDHATKRCRSLGITAGSDAEAIYRVAVKSEQPLKKFVLGHTLPASRGGPSSSSKPSQAEARAQKSPTPSRRPTEALGASSTKSKATALEGESPAKRGKTTPLVAATKGDVNNVKAVLEIWTARYVPKDLVSTLELRQDRHSNVNFS